VTGGEFARLQASSAKSVADFRACGLRSFHSPPPVAQSFKQLRDGTFGVDMAQECHRQRITSGLFCSVSSSGEGCPGVLDSQESQDARHFWRMFSIFKEFLGHRISCLLSLNPSREAAACENPARQCREVFGKRTRVPKGRHLSSPNFPPL